MLLGSSWVSKESCTPKPWEGRVHEVSVPPKGRVLREAGAPEWLLAGVVQSLRYQTQHSMHLTCWVAQFRSTRTHTTSYTTISLLVGCFNCTVETFFATQTHLSAKSSLQLLFTDLLDTLPRFIEHSEGVNSRLDLVGLWNNCNLLISEGNY